MRWKQTITGDTSLCYVIIILFYITLTLQIMLINVTYLDISVSNVPSYPKAWIILRMPAANQSLHYNTTQALIVWAHTQNDPCKASNCNVLKDNVCMIPLRTDLKTSGQLIWLETPYDHTGYQWESLHRSDGY